MNKNYVYGILLACLITILGFVVVTISWQHCASISFNVIFTLIVLLSTVFVWITVRYW